MFSTTIYSILYLTALYWNDGGKISRSYNGLASRIKIAAVSLQTGVGDDTQEVVLPQAFNQFKKSM